ncbi:MAG: hypothetical protein J7L28_02775 [Thermotogae bacterium]|nr:hypothetical protein [Thermotogota bacterium]RKX52434.1 MAG: hypothetical protein DRP30_06200 [Thermotoga sp.]
MKNFSKKDALISTLKFFVFVFLILLLISFFNMTRLSNYLFVTAGVSLAIALAQFKKNQKETGDPLKFDRLSFSALIFSGICFLISFLVGFFLT